MSALEYVKNITREDALLKITSSELKEYGVYQDKLSLRWDSVLKKRESHKVTEGITLIAALNNADTKGVLLQFLKSEPEKVLEGMAIAAYALHAKKAVLHLPDYEKEIAIEIKDKAEVLGIQVENGLVDVMSHEYDIVTHIVTMYEIHALFEDNYQPGVYVSVNGGSCKKYPNDSKVMSVLSETGVDVSDIKALELGYTFCEPQEKDKTLEQAGITNGVCNVYTSKDCILQQIKLRTEEFQRQSCGKCVFCREGLIQLQGMVQDATKGKGKSETLDILEEISSAMRFSTQCSLGECSAAVVGDSLQTWKKDYEEHVKKKACSAGVCFSTSMIYIDPQSCQGCEECSDVCPKDCIDGKKGFIHMIDEFDCTQCGKCMEVCEYDAIIQTTGKVPKLPNRLVKCGKFKKH